MWCINEELWLRRSELSTHIIHRRPPLMQLARLRVRSGVSRISGPCGLIERWDLVSGSLAGAVVTSQRFHINDWWAAQVCLGWIKSTPIWNIRKQKKKGPSFTSNYPALKVVSTMLMVTLLGRLRGGKHQITLTRTVGRSLWVGRSQMAESCVWCVWLLSSWPTLTCAHHSTDSRDQQGDPWWVQWKIMARGKPTSKTGVTQCCWTKGATMLKLLKL